MSSRAIPDAIGAYRDATNRMMTCSFTFKCAKCQGHKNIRGRKALPTPGRRKLYQCKQCAEGA